MESPAVDHVTGLAPRAALEGVLAAVVAPGAPPAAIAMVDCIGLKAVNEREGFRAGDARLKAAAGRLEAAARDARIVARLGGDELVAVFAGGDATEAAARAARELRGPGTPPLRAVAAATLPGDTAAALVDRAYAMLRRS